MKRILTFFVLLLWGAVLLSFRLSGRVASYLHPQFHAYVTVAGLGLLVLAGLWLWASRETDAACHHCGGHDNDAGPRGRLTAGSLLAFAVLLLPVSAAFFLSPGQFGEAAVMNRGIVTDISQLPTAEPSSEGWETAPAWDDKSDSSSAPWPEEKEEGVEYFTRAPDGSIQLETIDLLFAAQEPALREEFANQRVSIVGQYVPPRREAGGFDLVRMFAVCCAADARPLGIKVVGAPVKVPRMGWVRITGTAHFADREGTIEPSLELENIEEVEAPRETFLY